MAIGRWVARLAGAHHDGRLQAELARLGRCRHWEMAGAGK
jgi:hypothetical protein